MSDQFGRSIAGVAQRTSTVASAVVALPAGEFFELVCDQDAWISFTTSGGAVVAATADAIFLPAKVVRGLPRPAGGKATHLAAIRVSADGAVNIVGLA